MKIIGITGTNGKTTCVHIITNLLKDHLNCANFGTLGIKHYINNECFETPTTLTTLGNQDLHKHLKRVASLGCQLVAMEVSSHGIVQNRIANVDFVDLVFTNLSHDHLDYHQDMDNYFQAKSKLFIEYAKLANRAIINLDCYYGLQLIKLLQQNLPNPKLEIIGFSTKSLNQQNNSSQINNIKKITCETIKFNHSGIEASINTPWGDGKLSTNLLGIHNLSNLLASIAVCGSELSLATILQKSSNIQTPKGRLQALLVNSTNHLYANFSDNIADNTINLLPKIIIDYAHTPNGLENALLAIKNHYPKYKICCIFGCGGNRDIDKRPKMLQVAENYCNTIILTQDNSRNEDPNKIIDDILSYKIKNESINIYVKMDRREAIYTAINNYSQDHIILIAGKGHENKQIIGNNEHFFCDYAVAEEGIKKLLIAVL